MNKFTEHWITSTLAPESITNIKTDDINNTYLDIIKNENNTIKVYILSNNHKVIAIGTNTKAILESKQYTFREALKEVANILNITSMSI